MILYIVKLGYNELSTFNNSDFQIISLISNTIGLFNY